MDKTVHCRGITTVAVSDVAGDIATASNMSKSENHHCNHTKMPLTSEFSTCCFILKSARDSVRSCFADMP